MEGQAMWEVEFTDEFETWWEALAEGQQAAVDDRVVLLDDLYDEHLRTISDEL